jgi:hypothetical protein
MADLDRDARERAFTRRQTLGMAGAAGSALALGGVAGRAISGLGAPNEVDAAMAAKACKLTPEVTEGPFYVALERIRRDITEGRPGVPLTLKVRVIDVKRCKPIHSAAVDIWHCDAGGLYSDEPSNGTSGQTFLRGVQLSNKKGYATFRTVYPGHYTGRATHIHLKVHIGSKARAGPSAVGTSPTPASSSSPSPRTRASTRWRRTARTPRSARSTPRTASTHRRAGPAPRSASRAAPHRASSGRSCSASTPRQLQPRSENLSPS